MSKKLRVALLFGGQSAEHEISVQSARNILAALDPDRYETVLIGIDLDGVWRLMAPGFLESAPQGARVPAEGARLAVVPGGGGRFLTTAGGGSGVEAGEFEVDVVLPVLHGPHGEDGTIQGLLELAGVPYAGCGVLGSAVGMDKDVMKRLLRDAGLPVGKFLTFRREEALAAGFEEVAAEVGAPFFVKPANLGSSVGIHKVRGAAEWETCRADALRYDHKIIVEEFVDGREIEVAVLGRSPFTIECASVPGEIAPAGEFYDYESKYLRPDGARLYVPAAVTESQALEFRRLAARTCEALCAEGLSRVDFFLRKSDGAVFVNEINTFPGFTRVSMFPKLWEASGVPYAALLDRLIGLALDRRRADAGLETAIRR